MLHKTQGIVLKTTNYAETSVIAKIYTLDFGLQTYLINSVRTTRPKYSYAILQPLTLLDMVVYYKENKPAALQRVAQLQAKPVLHSLQTLPQSVLVAMFVAEVLVKCVHDAEPEPALYDFVHEQVLFLDENKPDADFIIKFLLELSGFLGFLPMANYHVTDAPFFNLENAIFEPYEGSTQPHANKGSSRLIGLLLQNAQYQAHLVPNVIRQEALLDVLKFYQIHIVDFGKLNSLAILQDIW